MKCNEWKSVLLDDLVESISIKHKFDKEKIIFLNTSDVLDGKVLHNKFSNVKDLPGQAKKSIQKNDILFSEIRPKNKRFAYVDFDSDDYVVSTKLMVLRKKSLEIDNIFLYKLLTWDKTLDYLQMIAESRSGTFPQITFNELKNIEVNLPTLMEQKKIVDILLAFDNKINLNNEMNKTLEEMAQVLFKRWFSDFEFPNEYGEPYKSSGGEMIESELGMIPIGWKVYSATDLVDSISVKHKFNKDKIIFLNTSDILDGEVLTNEYSEVASLPGQAKKSIQKNDILYSEIRPRNKRYAFIDFECEDYVVSTKLMVLRVKSTLSPILMYQFLTSLDTVDYLQSIAESRSGTFPQITFKELEKLKIALPDESILLRWNNTIAPLFYNIQENKRENKSLIEMRDSLLPKFMSGEIRLDNIEDSL